MCQIHHQITLGEKEDSQYNISVQSGATMKKKSRKILAPRNPYAMAAMTKKAGSHRKSNKALRRLLKSGRSSRVEQGTFNPPARVQSSPFRPLNYD